MVGDKIFNTENINIFGMKKDDSTGTPLWSAVYLVIANTHRIVLSIRSYQAGSKHRLHQGRLCAGRSRGRRPAANKSRDTGVKELSRSGGMPSVHSRPRVSAPLSASHSRSRSPRLSSPHPRPPHRTRLPILFTLLWVYYFPLFLQLVCSHRWLFPLAGSLPSMRSWFWNSLSTKLKSGNVTTFLSPSKICLFSFWQNCNFYHLNALSVNFIFPLFDVSWLKKIFAFFLVSNISLSLSNIISRWEKFQRRFYFWILFPDIML